MSWLLGDRDPPKETPPLKEPLFSAIAITPSKREKFVIIDSNDAGAESWCPPSYVAEITTYAIELSPKKTPSSPKETEELRSSTERWMKKIVEDEKFYRYRGPHEQYSWVKPIKVTAEGHPPTLKMEGLTLDMLGGFIRFNILESNLDVAHAFQNAAKAEYRGPLMSPLGADHDADDEYNPRPDPAKFKRENISTKSDSSIGDFGAAEPGQEYEHAVASLRQGLARGMIRGKEHFARAAAFVAAGTLKGLLPSPYPTAQKLLTDGSGHTDDEAGQRQMLGERLQQVVEDVLGPDQKLIWDPRQARKGVKVVGEPQEATLGEHVKRLKQEEERRIQQGNLPRWFLGSKQEWEGDLSRSMEAGRAWMEEQQRKIEAKGGLRSVIDDLLGDWKDLTDKQADEKARKEELKNRLKGEKAIEKVGFSPEQQGITTWHDVAFFGVTHKKEVYTGEYYGPESMAEKEYTTRNPLIDPPRKLPRSLHELLKREGIKERAQLPRGHEEGGKSAGISR